MTNVLFFDVDGTLMTVKDGRQYVPPSAVEAMHEARRRGCRQYLCTGRSLAEARTIPELPIDGIIGAAGGFVLDGNEMVFHRMLEKDDVYRIEAYLRENDAIYNLECNEGVYFVDEFLEFARTNWGVDPNSEWHNIAHTLEGVDRSRVNKMTFRMPAEVSFEEVEEELGDDYYLVRSSYPDQTVTAGEISVKGVNKATAIDRLLEHLELDDVRTFGFGDSQNDAEMLARCDEAIVMGDARHPEVKRYASYVTSPVLEDGIAEAMRHFDLA